VKFTVFGVGGAGGNIVNHMIESNLVGVEFIVANTDAQALAQTKAKRIQIGRKSTQGNGAGGRPDQGKKAAEESMDEILEELGTPHMLFVTAGLGGGTGTGAAPLIAEAARKKGILTVAVVTTPFSYEGNIRTNQAERGRSELEKGNDLERGDCIGGLVHFNRIQYNLNYNTYIIF
jgi:cell division protein FtsZ